MISRKGPLGQTYNWVIVTVTALVWLVIACNLANSPSSPINSVREPLQLGPGDHVRSMEFDGLTRTYRIHIPPSYDKSKPIPLILAFHGGLGTGQAMEKLSSLDEVADKKGILVVYPDGVGRSWNAGHGTGKAERQEVNDVGFIAKLIDDLVHDFRVDPRRVYATGMSNGAMFVHRLACERSDKIAAIAPVAGTMPSKLASDCHPGRPVSVLEIHGTSDRDSPWDGGRTIGGGQVQSVSATIREWAAHNQCKSPPKVTNPAKDVTSETYDSCQQGTEVRLYRIENGGHTWPGGYQYLPRSLVGETNRNLNASEVIWDFFEKHPMAEH